MVSHLIFSCKVDTHLGHAFAFGFPTIFVTKGWRDSHLSFRCIGILFLVLLLLPLPFGHCGEDNRKGKEGCKIALKVFMP